MAHLLTPGIETGIKYQNFGDGFRDFLKLQKYLSQKKKLQKHGLC